MLLAYRYVGCLMFYDCSTYSIALYSKEFIALKSKVRAGVSRPSSLASVSELFMRAFVVASEGGKRDSLASIAAYKVLSYWVTGGCTVGVKD